MFSILFAHAEVGEDFTEDGVGGDFAGDFTQPVEAFADVLVEQIAGQAVVKAVDGAGDGVAGAGEGLVMAGVGDDDGIAVHIGQGGGLDDEAPEGLDVFLALGADGHDGCAFGQQVVQFASRGYIIVKVGLVENGDEGLALAAVEDVMGHAGVSACDVNNPKHDVGLVDGLPCALNAHALDGVAGLADACRVDEAEQRAAHHHGVLDGVAGGTVDIAHQGAVVAQQGVKQGGFAGIGLPHDGDGHAVADGVAVTVTVGQA